MMFKTFALWLGGAVVGLGLFDRAAVLLAGTGWPWVAHVAIAGVAALILVRMRSPVYLRPALAAFAVTLLFLSAVSAVLVPRLIRARALELADGRPFCLVGPEISVDPEAQRRDPFHLEPAPAETGDLTYLTLPRPLTLVIALPEPETEDGPGGKPDPVFALMDWDSLSRSFAEAGTADMHDAGDSRLLDCTPEVDPFTARSATDPVAMVVWRDPMPASANAAGWGPRRTALVRPSFDLAPTHFGRFAPARMGLTAALLPGADPMPLTLDWTADPSAWLDGVRQGRIRDQDKPLDWASLPVNSLGLVAYEVPSTSLAEAIEGTYVLTGPDGALRTIIACDVYFCRHHSLVNPPIPAILSVTYPVALLPKWHMIETEARARWAGAITSGG